MEKNLPINLFEYRDYRSFLRDWFGHMKSVRRTFSFRVFSRQAGIASPNFLKLVMEDARNLSEDGSVKFARGLQMNKLETDFFKHLVLFNQAKTHDEKIHYEKRLMKSRKLSRVMPIVRDQYHLYSAWHHPVVLELILHPKFDGTPEFLARKIKPAITPTEARKSLELLLRLGFIAKDENGKYKPSTPVVTTGPEVMSLILLDYHRQLLKLCAEQLPEIHEGDRDVSSLCFAVSKQRLPALKKRIQEFRQDIIRDFGQETSADDVVFLNTQLFPVTGGAPMSRSVADED